MTTQKLSGVPLSWPERWPATSGLRRFLAPVGLAVMGTMFLIASILLVSHGQLMGLVTIAFTPALLIGVGTTFLELNVSPRRDFRSVEEATLSARPAVFMPWSRVELVARRALYAGFFLMSATLPILMSIVPDDGSREYGRISTVSVVTPLFAVGFGAYLVAGFVRRGRMGLGLSPAGVYHRSWFGTCFYAWESIQQIRPVSRPRLAVLVSVHEAAKRNPNPEETPISGLGPFRRSMTRIQAGALAVNPALAYHALQFYLAHPHLRHELGTESGVERIRAAAFTIPADIRTTESVDDR